MRKVFKNVKLGQHGQEFTEFEIYWKEESKVLKGK